MSDFLGIGAEEFKKNDNLSNNASRTPIFWTDFLYIVSIINFVCGVIVGLFLWYYIAEEMYNGLLGFFIGITFVLFTMVSTSTIMIFVEMSKNVAKNKNNTDKILEKLSVKNN